MGTVETRGLTIAAKSPCAPLTRSPRSSCYTLVGVEAKPGSSSHVFRSHETKAI